MQGFQIESNSSEETLEFGKKIAKNLKPGQIIALNGELGSGKTCLTKGIALGIGIKETVTSPTYTIISEYPVNNEILFYHVDAYRLNTERDFTDIGGEEILYSGGFCIIEWSDKIKNLLPNNTISIFIEITGQEKRNITVKGIENFNGVKK
ncbi:MAG: tRNA (adenosine(37)-N6)-threonylcarbamoyltransferase complex ATPase subunit type 1 TsaE [Treponema sp.]|jgi:tRNA threonylcarbamoyladenosine biosynthesis protein TsaE|nr:tRNA (adenosine(37)-N6)-threonylcarbamoyltransferase complex ATPase subunit type 1 TsaE [Treponema sp.]